MAKSTMWMVRAGEGGLYFDTFKAKSIVAIGWNDLGDLSSVNSQEEIRRLYESAWSNEKPAKVANAVAMLFKFRHVLKPADWVITYNPETREYLVGTIKGEYKHDAMFESHNFRLVDWQGQISRDNLKPATRNSLGSTLTLFQVNETATEDILQVLQGVGGPEDSESEVKEELEQIKEDTISQAHELIKDKILQLSPDEMELLVATVLKAMGYKARVTPKGADRGVDVIASPDGLGLEEPRIKAEVKHRLKSQMSSQDLRSFIGGLRQGDRGLYVSTGGFSKDARYEADRSNIPITLLNLDELATLVVTHYENFDMDGRVLVPLTRLYWPVE